MSTAALASLLPLPVAVPLVGAAVAPLVARISGRLTLITSMACLVSSSVILLAMAPTVYRGAVLAHFMGHWVPVEGQVLGDAFAADPFGLSFALVAALIGSVLLLFTLSEQSNLGQRELGAFTSLFLLLVAGLIGSALTADLLNLFVWFEVAALASYALTAFFLERPLALEAAFKILVLTNLAGFLVFLGTALIYAQDGALNFAQIYHTVSVHSRTAETIALALLVAGFGTKAGLVPFHGWLPDAHTAAPGTVSALFSGLMVNLGIVAVARLTFQVFTPERGRPVLGLLMVVGLVSAIGAAFFALVQDDLKRLLAYDTISQMGVLTVGLASGRAAGLTGASYQLINHALFKSILFLCAGSIVHATGATKLSEMGGLGRRMPGVAAAFTLGAVAIAGLPPLNGYAGVGLIHDSLLDSRQYVPFAAMLAAQVLTVAALGKATWQAFDRPAQASNQRDERLRPGMAVSLGLLGSACLAFGALPYVFLPHLAVPAAAGLLAPAAYAGDILASGGPLPTLHVAFAYFKPRELVTVVASAIAAVPIGRTLLSRRSARIVERVRRIQTGSVNDYAGYLVVGLLTSVAVLTIGH